MEALLIPRILRINATKARIPATITTMPPPTKAALAPIPSVPASDNLYPIIAATPAIPPTMTAIRLRISPE